VTLTLGKGYLLFRGVVQDKSTRQVIHHINSSGFGSKGKTWNISGGQVCTVGPTDALVWKPDTLQLGLVLVMVTTLVVKKCSSV
jgi:hypothetical protein